MSRKSVPFSFSMSAKPESARPPAADVVIDAHSDDWVSDRHAPGEEKPAAASLLLDLAAERTLTEVLALSLFAPFALGWFWLMNATAGRMRF